MKLLDIKVKDQEHPDVHDFTFILLSNEDGVLSINMTDYRGQEVMEQFKDQIDNAEKPELIASFSFSEGDTILLEEIYKLVFDDFVIYFQRIMTESIEEPTNVAIFRMSFSDKAYKLHFRIGDEYITKFRFLEESELKKRLSKSLKLYKPLYIKPDIAEQLGVK
jgi:hypothetical protein